MTFTKYALAAVMAACLLAFLAGCEEENAPAAGETPAADASTPPETPAPETPRTEAAAPDTERPAGETPAVAPETPAEDQAKTYKCPLCNYVYEPAEGDPENGVEPGTAFKDLPDDWICPQCGTDKDEFEEE